MKRYDKLINKACECIIKAADARRRGDTNMQKFWNNAYEGFKRKANRLMEMGEQSND